MNTEETLDYIRRNVSGIARITRKDAMGNAPKSFQDKYATEQQNLRDKQITDLLYEYVRNYKGKTNSNRKYKKVIFGVTMGIVILYSLLVFALFVTGLVMTWVDSDGENTEYIEVIEHENGTEVEAGEAESETSIEEVEEIETEKKEQEAVSVEMVVSLITVCVSYLTLVFGLLTIITKYVFPEKEEEYITAIVKLIQKNDLENKRENMRTDGYELVKKESDKDEE